MRQRLADAQIIERLALVVECDNEAGHPGAFEDDRVVFHLREHAVTLGRRNAPELDVELAAGKAGRERGAFDEERLEAVEMRVARPEVGVSSPHRIRMAVDFPAPFGPRNPKISPFFT